VRWRECIESPGGRRWHDVAYWGTLLATCAVFWQMNVLTPLKEDDMAFVLVGRLSSMHEVLQSQVDHFMTANGRFADVLATLFCALVGKPVFNVLNALVFGLMAHLLSLLSTGRRSLVVVAAFLAFVGVFYPLPGQTLLFVAGSCNYLWAITASLLLVRYLQRHRGRRLGWWRGLLLVLAAFVAGNFNEGTSFGFFAGMVLYYLLNREQVTPRVVLALVGYLLGMLLIVSSPGAWNRAAEGGIVLDMGLGDLVMTRWHLLADRMMRYVTPLLAAVLGIGVLAWKGLAIVKRYLWTYIFLCLTLVMFALGVTQERAYAPLATVAFIITASVADALLARRYWLRLGLAVGCLALACYTFTHAMQAMSAYQQFEQGIQRELAAAPRQAVLHERDFGWNHRFVTPLCFSSAGFFVREDIYCAFYDKDNVQFVGDSVYARYHEGRLLDGAQVLPFKSDRPDVLDTMLLIAGQDYMVGLLKGDTIPFCSQQARYHMAKPGAGMTDAEHERRRYYGLANEYLDRGFYPLRYQGRCLLVFPVADSTVSRIEFPIDMRDPLATIVTLKR